MILIRLICPWTLYRNHLIHKYMKLILYSLIWITLIGLGIGIQAFSNEVSLEHENEIEGEITQSLNTDINNYYNGN